MIIRPYQAVLLAWCCWGSGQLFLLAADESQHPIRSSSSIFDSGAEESWDIWGLTRKYESWFYSIGASVVIGLSGILPLFVVRIGAGPSSIHEGGAARNLRLLLSFAVGGLLGDVFLHLLPEAWDHLEKRRSREDSISHMYIGMWVLIGIFTFSILEMVFSTTGECVTKNTKDSREAKTLPEGNGPVTSVSKSDEVQVHRKHLPASSARNRVSNSKKNSHDKHHQSNGYANGHCNHQLAKPTETQNTKHVTGYLNLLANSIDNFTHGLAVAGSFLVSKKVGLLTTCAILVHEIPHEFGDFAILLKSGFTRWEAAKAQLLTAMMGLVGAITALSVDSAQTLGERTIWILPFTAGGFLNIALVNVLPDLLKEKDLKEGLKSLLCLSAGVSIMAGVRLLCE